MYNFLKVIFLHPLNVKGFQFAASNLLADKH